MTLPPLPDDLNELKRMVLDLVSRLHRSELEQARLRELLEAKRERSSEKLSEDQLALFAAMWEARQESAGQDDDDGDDDAEPPASTTGNAPARKRKRTGRPALPKDLPRELIEHDVPGKDQPCADCLAPLRLIGEDRSERLEVIPARMKVIEEVCFKYACQCRVHTATKPAQPLLKNMASASVLATPSRRSFCTICRCTGKSRCGRRRA